MYEYLYRQIEDKKVRETIDFLLNREEAHNAMFREAFNKVQNSGSNRDFGTTKAAKMYFSLSEPSPDNTPFPKLTLNRRHSAEVNMKKNEMPVGLGMALAINPEAMQKFASLPETKRQEIIYGTHTISSKYVTLASFNCQTPLCLFL